jgi:hypothetical protein
MIPKTLSDLRNGKWGTMCGVGGNECFTPKVIDTLELFFEQEIEYEFEEAENRACIVDDQCDISAIGSVYLQAKDGVELTDEMMQEYDILHQKYHGEPDDILSEREPLEIVARYISLLIDDGDGSWRPDVCGNRVYFETE